MKISIVCYSFPNLSETFIAQQALDLIALGHDVEILTIKTYDPTLSLPTQYSELNGKIFSIKKDLKNSNKKLLSFYYLKKLKTIESDLFIVHFGTTAIKLLPLIKNNKLSGKLLLIIHGYDISTTQIRNKHKNNYKEVFHYFDKIISVNNFFKKYLIELNCPKQKIHTIHTGIDTNNYTLSPPVPMVNSTLNLVTTARLVEKKGIETAIRACENLKKNNIPFQYKVIGDGPLKPRLIDLINDLNLSNEVTLLGGQPHSHVKDILNNSHIFILTSQTAEDGDSEGIPVSLMEAMALGIITISTYHSGIPELINNYETGFLIKEKDHEHLSKLIIEIYNGKFDLDNIRINAINQIQANFDSKSELIKLLKITDI